MKRILVIVLPGLLLSCHAIKDAGPAPRKEIRVTLQDTVGWATDTLSQGLIWYQYMGYYEPFSAFQSINVMEVDLDQGDYRLRIDNERPSDSLSTIAAQLPGALAGINGTYYEIVDSKDSSGKWNSSFLKSDGAIKSEVTVPEGHRLFWKHEGAFFYDPEQKKAGIVYGNNDSYKELPYPYIVSGSPMLIYKYKPVGEKFAKPHEIPLDSLDYEHPDRHQGVRHPRTAVALMNNGNVLLITVDGRAEKAAGMSARELTQFIQKYFNPENALNLDGGGSTTMWIKNSNLSSTGVVNYPTDDKRFDHYGQRQIRNYIMIIE